MRHDLKLMVEHVCKEQYHPHQGLNALLHLANEQDYDVQIHFEAKHIRIEVAVYDEEQEQRELFVAKGYSPKDLDKAINNIIQQVYTNDQFAPLGLTPQWRKYFFDMMAWELNHPYIKDDPNHNMDRAMAEPNKPGYYRANND